ncbi:MAG: hypothetical protein AAFQ44_09985, partial [Pseudomonadota bacterium]
MANTFTTVKSTQDRAGASRPLAFGFLLVPGFSLMAMTSALEPLRLANRVTSEELYTFELFSVDGGPVMSSAG